MPLRRFLCYDAIGAPLWATAFVMLGYLFGSSWRVAETWIGRASAIVGIVLLLMIALGWLWRWLT
jgi:membrane protein DedA with SNARE-associated domain